MLIGKRRVIYEEADERKKKRKENGSLFYFKLTTSSSSSLTPTKCDMPIVVFFLLEFKMSDEIKNEFDDINIENNQENEQSEEIIEKLSINEEEEEEEEEENEQPLSTPNGRETLSPTSFNDVIIQKHDALPSVTSEENHTYDLLQIITDKSNREASSMILNTVK